MNLNNDFFTLDKMTATLGGFAAEITFNRDHFVYSAHFPGHPVTPGVIQIQIVHELIEKYTGYNLNLKEILDCKFLHIINPIDVFNLTIQIELKTNEESINAKAIGKNKGKIYFRLHSTYKFDKN